MKKESQDKQFNRDSVKVYGYKRFLKSIKYSLSGLFYAYRYEQSLWIHVFATVLAIIMGIIFHIKLSEWAIIFIALGSILGSYLGSIIEEKLALGNNMLVCVVNEKFENKVKDKLKNYQITTICEKDTKQSILLIFLKIVGRLLLL